MCNVNLYLDKTASCVLKATSIVKDKLLVLCMFQLTHGRQLSKKKASDPGDETIMVLIEFSLPLSLFI